QILTILKANSCSIGRKSGEIWTGQALLQPISLKSDRLLGITMFQKAHDVAIVVSVGSRCGLTGDGGMEYSARKSGLISHV
ncbi:MAG: hypothetical protein L0H15_08055, partial [Nitrosospira sp.]|nr:hypothetical protein [Nitrosospira sp.]